MASTSGGSSMWPPLVELASISSINQLLLFYKVEASVWKAFCDAAGDPKDDLRPLAALPPPMIAAAVGAAEIPSSTTGKLSLMEWG